MPPTQENGIDYLDLAVSYFRCRASLAYTRKSNIRYESMAAAVESLRAREAAKTAALSLLEQKCKTLEAELRRMKESPQETRPCGSA